MAITSQNAAEPNDFGQIRNGLEKFINCFDAFNVSINHKENFASELSKTIELNMYEQNVFIRQTESILKYENQTLA